MSGHSPKANSQISVLLADSTFLGAELLSGALRRCQNLFEVVGCAFTSAEAIRIMGEFRPRLALISVNLKDGEAAGYKVVSHAREHHLATQAIALLEISSREKVLEAFRSGARGVVSREESFRLVAKCLRKVHDGEIWANNDQIGFVFETLKDHAKPRLTPAAGIDQLTPREKEVVLHVVEGLRNAEIGEKLGVTEHTVRNYIMRIYDKLGVSNRVQLTRQCAELFESTTSS